MLLNIMGHRLHFLGIFYSINTDSSSQPQEEADVAMGFVTSLWEIFYHLGDKV